jgi:hypothetical protein
MKQQFERYNPIYISTYLQSGILLLKNRINNEI